MQKINTLEFQIIPRRLGLEEEEQNEESNKNTKVAQPPASQQVVQSQAPSQPPAGPMNHPYSGPNFDNMYVETTTPLVNAQTPGNMPTNASVNNYNNQMMEPMAANDFGGMGGALF